MTVCPWEVLIYLGWVVKMGKRGYIRLAYIVMAIVRWDVLLVHIAIMCHRVPGPGRVSSYSTYMIPVISRTCIVYHVVWADLEDVNGVGSALENSLLIELDPPRILPRG